MDKEIFHDPNFQAAFLMRGARRAERNQEMFLGSGDVDCFGKFLLELGFSSMLRKLECGGCPG